MTCGTAFLASLTKIGNEVILLGDESMSFGDKLRRMAGWCSLGLAAMFCLLGYYFGNIRFAPLAGGFLILAAVGLIERGEEQAKGNAIQPGADPRVG